jgi:diacylglycerol kinase family enzyme
VFNGKLLEHSGVEGYQAKKVVVEFQKDEPVEFDGESFWAKKIFFSIIPRGYKGTGEEVRGLPLI